MDKIIPNTQADRFVLSLRETGETYGNETFLDVGTYFPGADDDLDDWNRKMIIATVGIVITDTPVRIVVEYYQNRTEYSSRKAAAVRRTNTTVLKD